MKKTVQEILNTVLVDDTITTVVSSQQALNIVFDSENSALRVTGTGGGGEPEILEYANLAAFPVTGESEKIYIAIDTNSMYRWDGADYAGMSGGVALGETETTAYRGDRGKTAYDHSQTAHAPADAEQNVNADWNSVSGDSEILNKPSSFTPSAHAANHTSGADDIQDATASQKGLMTAAQAAKLDGIDPDASSLWAVVDSGDFTATPASTSTLTMLSDLTATVKAGMGIRYTISSIVYYGFIKAVTSNLLTVGGGPLSGDVTQLEYLTIPLIETEFKIDGYFAGSATTTGIKTGCVLPVSPQWNRNPAYLVGMKLATSQDDGGTVTTQPTINPTIAGGAVLSTAKTIPDGAWAWTDIEFTAANQKIEFGEILEITIAVATGSAPNHDSADLWIQFLFVPEIA